MSFPAIEDLPEFVGALERRELYPALRHYNPSICAWRGRRLMVYRCETAEGKQFLGLCELDGLKPRPSVRVDTLAPDGSLDQEDPRLVVMGDRLYLSFAEVDLKNPANCICRQCLVELGEDLRVLRRVPLDIWRNGTQIEKNWSWFDAYDPVMQLERLGLVYRFSPMQVMLLEPSGRPLNGVHSSEGIARWNHGAVNGRTPPLRLDKDRFFTFFGGWRPHPSRIGFYYFAAATFSAKPPYEVLGMSRSPIAFGSDRSFAYVSPRAPMHNPLCIFPAGMVFEGEDVILSVGVNDSWCCFLRYNVPKLLAGMAPPAVVHAGPAIAPDRATSLSSVRVRVREDSCPLAEPGGPYQRGGDL